MAAITTDHAFLRKHQDKILGVLSCFDRVIIRGHLPISGTGYFMGWLSARKFCLRKEAPEGWYPLKEAMPEFAEDLKVHAQAVAAAAGRP